MGWYYNPSVISFGNAISLCIGKAMPSGLPVNPSSVSLWLTPSPLGRLITSVDAKKSPPC